MILEKILKDVDNWIGKVAEFQMKAIHNKDYKISIKDSDINLVTDIDIKSEEMLIEFIKRKYPNHSILSEESGINNYDSEYMWVIDPIDGTTNFIHGFPMFSISVALKYKDITRLGIVYAPMLNMKFNAIRGKGAYLNGEKIVVSKTSDLKNSLISTGFPYNRMDENINLKYFNKIVNKISGIRRTGSAAVDLCLVAASFLDGYWEFNLNEWDICAGTLILEEAKGKITHLNEYGNRLTVCGNVRIHDLLIESLLNE